MCGIIGNTDVKSKDYDAMKNLMRPGHADYTGYIRYGGFADYRGGGHFSGRLTAPIVFAGAIAYQYLQKKGITIGTHILKIGSIDDEPLNAADIPADILNKFRGMRFPVVSPGIEEKIKEEIDNARRDLDSVGGILETAVVNVPAGLGSPMFNSVESKLSAFVFSIPAVKGIEFGSGFGFAQMRGSEANDQFTADGKTVNRDKSYGRNKRRHDKRNADCIPHRFQAHAFNRKTAAGSRYFKHGKHRTENTGKTRSMHCGEGCSCA